MGTSGSETKSHTLSDDTSGHHKQNSPSGLQLLSSNLQGNLHPSESLTPPNSERLLHTTTEEMDHTSLDGNTKTPEDQQTTPLQANHNIRRQRKDARKRNRRRTIECTPRSLTATRPEGAALISTTNHIQKTSFDDLDIGRSELTLATLTQIPTNDLPEVLGPTVFRSQKVEEWANNRLGTPERRSRKNRTHSQGVATMRTSGSQSDLSSAKQECAYRKDDTTASSKNMPEGSRASIQPRPRTRAKSEGVAERSSSINQIQAKTFDQLDNSGAELTIATPSQVPAKDLPGCCGRKNTQSVELTTKQSASFLSQEDTKVERTASDGVFGAHPPGHTRVLDRVPQNTFMKKTDSTMSSVDGDSDLDDMPEALCTLDTAFQEGQNHLSVNERLATFFLSKSYQKSSFFFGPMFCFLIVAMRIEAFNIASGAMEPRPNTWNLSLSESFWIELVWYCMMIAEMLIVILTFLARCDREGLVYSSLAAGWGCMINVGCLLLLIIAEMERCCDDGSSRLLGEGSYSIEFELYPTAICSCPEFGKRTYGGLGKIEPFTCLIALSQLRFLFAMKVVRAVGKSHADNLRSQRTENDQSHGHELDLTKAREIWIVAIGKHSQTARSQGLFSREVLLCMLGIYNEEHDKDDVDSCVLSNRSEPQTHEIHGDIVSPLSQSLCFDQFSTLWLG